MRQTRQVRRMRAARFHAFGGVSVIGHDEVPRPRPGAGEVLVRVAATSFNPTEAALRAGLLQGFRPVELPYTPGWDVAGTVAELGPHTGGFAVGDRVVGWLDRAGAAAEYVRAPAGSLVAATVSVPLAHAAALPLAGLTAWQAVVEQAEVTAGRRVLVNGAGGGIGGFATRFAKRAGAEVIATAGPRSERAVRRQGADRVVDYTAGPVAAALDRPVDVLLNLVPLSPSDAAALAPAVRPGGRIVSVATPIEPVAGSGVRATHLIARNDPARLAALVALLDAGELTLDISATHPLSDLADVHLRSAAGLLRGKVLLTP
ncbi:putative oxidoreductase [Kitasatospora setae KM-6054]|uniref:Putative oxidoreductase n=1 Tax=Kitasatospora setae (strain ATCC 33774 / DSM 43861 / JCM 3304 / KCC A-0304 / NBRC 14216 / KM-6054) TaxID=452652 RepID=E4NJI3_KITSK|nr:putative oxidoreductase [Kitasatospora setae KM-6054]